MSNSTPRYWLVTYDITDRRRLGRIHRHLKKVATPFQYSVFLFEGTQAQMGAVMAQLGRIANKNEDDIRAYAIPNKLNAVALGCNIVLPGLIVDALTHTAEHKRG